MAQRRRRRARCMLHCPQRHVLGMRGWISACALRARCGGYRSRCAVAYRVLRQPGRVYTHRCARPLPRLYTQTGRDTLAKWSARSRDASRSRHRHRNLLAYASSPSNGQVLRFSVDSPQCHSVFLADARDPRVSFRSTYDQLTAPAQTLPSLPKPFSDCSLHRHARNCHSTCT